MTKRTIYKEQSLYKYDTTSWLYKAVKQRDTIAQQRGAPYGAVSQKLPVMLKMTTQ